MTVANPTPPQLDAFLGALRAVESGGNYDEPNGQGAYQILQSNWPTWARETIGYRTTDADASDAPPVIQDEVAEAKVTSYYYGAGGRSWRKVARIWNGGSPDPVPNPALGPGATTDDYADRVLTAMGKAVPPDASGYDGATHGDGTANAPGVDLTGDDWITALDGALNPDLGGGLSLNPLKDAGDIGKAVAMIGTRISFAIVGVTLLGAGLLLAFGRDIFARTPVGAAAETVAEATEDVTEHDDDNEQERAA